MKSLAELEQLRARAEQTASFTYCAKALLLGGSRAGAAKLAENDPRAPRQALAALQRSAAALHEPAFTDTAVAQAAFLDSLIGISVFDTLLNGGARRLPLRTRLVSALAVPAGATPGEGAYKPISSIDLGQGGLQRRKGSAILAMTKEALEAGGSSGEAFLASELRQALTRAVDDAFVDLLVAEGAPSPPLTSEGSFEADAQAAIAALDIGTGSRIYMLASSKQVTSIELALSLHGAAATPVTLLGSDVIADGTALAVDAAGLAMGADPVELGTAQHASLQMTETPSAGAQQLVSLWQTGALALRVERYWGAMVTRAAAVVAFDGVNWADEGLYADGDT